MRLIIPALAIGLVTLYFISKQRKVEFEIELKVEPKDGAKAGPETNEEAH